MQAIDYGDLFDVVLDANGEIIGVVKTDVLNMQVGKDGTWQYEQKGQTLQQ